MKKGFTLIEVLVAISIFAFAILAVAGFFVYANKSIRYARNTTIASNLAQGLIDKELAKSYEELAIGTSSKDRFSADQTNPYYNYQKQIAISYIDSNLNTSSTNTGLKKILVTIFWQEGLNEKNIQMASIKTER